MTRLRTPFAVPAVDWSSKRPFSSESAAYGGPAPHARSGRGAGRTIPARRRVVSRARCTRCRCNVISVASADAAATRTGQAGSPGQKLRFARRDPRPRFVRGRRGTRWPASSRSMSHRDSMPTYQRGHHKMSLPMSHPCPHFDRCPTGNRRFPPLCGSGLPWQPSSFAKSRLPCRAAQSRTPSVKTSAG